MFTALANSVVDLGGKIKVPCGEVVYYGTLAGALAVLAEHGGDMTQMIGGTATAGDEGTATVGYRGTATAGYRGTATAGEYGTATAGEYGTATVGYGGTILLWWHDGQRQRVVVSRVGEQGINPNVAYQCKDGKIVEVAHAPNA